VQYLDIALTAVQHLQWFNERAHVKGWTKYNQATASQTSVSYTTTSKAAFKVYNEISIKSRGRLIVLKNLPFMLYKCPYYAQTMQSFFRAPVCGGAFTLTVHFRVNSERVGAQS